MAGVLVVMALVMVGFILAANSVQFGSVADFNLTGQIGLVADFMLTVFVLLPIVLMCLIPTLILMAMAIGLWKLNNMAVRPLGRGRQAVIRQLNRVSDNVPRLAAPVIKMQGGLGYLERVVTGRPEPEQPSPEEEQTYGN